MYKPAIVVIAYNRDLSLKRLLNSLNNAEYADDNVSLIISIDKSDNTKVAMIANLFEWKHGEKRVVIREEKMGLKKHVLSCGDYVDEFDSIIVLEDDLFVSKEFYSYACATLEFTSHDERIAGVSLYNHKLNVHVREPFEAIDDGYDNYYMQFAQSWGQAYTKEQWHSFKGWLKDNDTKPVEADNIPANVSSWSDKSWLKYYIKYIVDTDKYFIYPRISLTTNFGDEGTHAKNAVNDLQVELAGIKKGGYSFSTLEESEAVYDAFFESVSLIKKVSDIIGADNTYLRSNENVSNLCKNDTGVHSCKDSIADGLSENNNSVYSCKDDIVYGDITVDLYGYKGKDGRRFLITSKSLPYKALRSYARQLRPLEANVINEMDGNDLFLYDTAMDAAAPKVNEAGKILYNYKALNVKKMLEVLKHRIVNR